MNNGCGVSANGLTVFPGYGCGGYYAISIYPNPATEELTVEMRAENNVDALSSESPKIDEVLLVNSESEKVKSSVQTANKYKFDLRGLKKGRYFIHVRMGKEIVKEQVVIN